MQSEKYDASGLDLSTYDEIGIKNGAYDEIESFVNERDLTSFLETECGA